MRGGVGEAAARADFGQLVVVANEQNAPTSGHLASDNGLECADVGHARLVNDEERLSGGCVMLTVPSKQQRVERARRDLRSAGQFEGSACRWRSSVDVPACGLKDGAHSVHREGLAGACGADQDGYLVVCLLYTSPSPRD